MNGAKLSDKELNDIIFEGIKENNLDVSKVDKKDIEHLLAIYHLRCCELKHNYVKGDLDTFKRASCLAVSIARSTLPYSKEEKALIGLDVAYHMISKPYIYVGEHYDKPKALEEVDIKKVFKDNGIEEALNHSKETLKTSLVLETSKNSDTASTMQYCQNFQILYDYAIEVKYHAERTKENEGAPKVKDHKHPSRFASLL